MSKKDRVLERVNRCISHCTELTRQILREGGKDKAVWYLVAPRTHGQIVGQILEAFHQGENLEGILDSLREHHLGGDVFLSKAPADLRGFLIIMMRHGEREASFYDYDRNDTLLIHCDIMD